MKSKAIALAAVLACACVASMPAWAQSSGTAMGSDGTTTAPKTKSMMHKHSAPKMRKGKNNVPDPGLTRGIPAGDPGVLTTPASH